jgi:hypothetical protein
MELTLAIGTLCCLVMAESTEGIVDAYHHDDDACPVEALSMIDQPKSGCWVIAMAARIGGSFWMEQVVFFVKLSLAQSVGFDQPLLPVR